MPKELTVGSVTAKPGQVKYGPATSVELKDGTAVRLPVILVNGAEDGPTVVMTAAVHPTELIGTEAVRIATREVVDPKTLKGRIIAFPLTNPLGAQFGHYVSPHDGVNMSVAFPGSSEGTLTSRLANFIWENATKKADLAIDTHENVRPCLHFSIVGYSEKPGVEKRALDAANAFGITVIRPGKADFQLPGRRAGDLSYSQRCMLEGIPAFTPEFEGSYELSFNKDEVSIQVAARGLLNVLKHMKMIPGRVEEQKGIPVLRGNFTFRGMLKANKGGIVHRLAETGVELRKGTQVARIYNSYGDPVETVTMPYEGYIWGWTVRDWMVQTGGTICFCFTEQTS